MLMHLTSCHVYFASSFELTCAFVKAQAIWFWGMNTELQAGYLYQKAQLSSTEVVWTQVPWCQYRKTPIGFSRLWINSSSPTTFKTCFAMFRALPRE